MTDNLLIDLQKTVRSKETFTFHDYFNICNNFLKFIESKKPTRIISPSPQNRHYIFYQYGEEVDNKITRPLNTRLFIESSIEFEKTFERFMAFLSDLRMHQEAASSRSDNLSYVESKEVNKNIYTIQQAIGCIGDTFENPNQARKKIGQLFETLIKLIIQEVGLICEPRTISVPIPGFPGYKMSYELDVVFSREKAILTSESEHKYIHPSEIIGSVKTTSKDRIDKIFLDKFLLTKLLEREVPVVAIFLHDVQRASATRDIDSSGDRYFKINSTFKTNHFLGYTVALNRLDGVYYVDPRPEMVVNQKLREQIFDFQTFLIIDLWEYSK
ncbi:MAG TPA: hypothetical protein VKY19_09460 [Ktedonosporobacter sp.]|jgi:hypothetical protein|nr:hypothetical protein [Ktedonosporobacter sp.]